MGFDKDLRALLKTVKKISRRPFADIGKSRETPDGLDPAADDPPLREKQPAGD